MDKNILVTVIIPVYNMVGFVDEAVKSVIQQTYKNLEIIIIDDGSTDGSGARCDEYEKIDSRIRIIHQENRGLGNARNKGLNEMTGDAVAFLDSDDGSVYQGVGHFSIAASISIPDCPFTASR